MNATDTESLFSPGVAQIEIDAEFEALIPSLDGEERTLLEESLKREGCREPLVVWEEKRILLDGHNRYAICKRHGIRFDVQYLQFEDRFAAIRWMIENQLGRRNLTAYDRARLALKLEPAIKVRAKENQRAAGRAVPENSPEAVETREEVAKAAGVSSNTISKVKVIEEKADAETKAELSRGDISINAAHKRVVAASKVERAREIAAAPKSTKNVASRLDTLIESGARFGCIYVDPPWTCYRDEGDEASHMTLREIRNLSVPALAADDAVLHLWSSTSALPDALRLMKNWGFRYQTCFVSVRSDSDVGEFWDDAHDMLLLGIRGDPEFNGHGTLSWAEFPHKSEGTKPDEVRALVTDSTAGPYLELFGTAAIDGWTVWTERDGVLSDSEGVV